MLLTATRHCVLLSKDLAHPTGRRNTVHNQEGHLMAEDLVSKDVEPENDPSTEDGKACTRHQQSQAAVLSDWQYMTTCSRSSAGLLTSEAVGSGENGRAPKKDVSSTTGEEDQTCRVKASTDKRVPPAAQVASERPLQIENSTEFLDENAEDEKSSLVGPRQVETQHRKIGLQSTHREQQVSVLRPEDIMPPVAASGSEVDKSASTWKIPPEASLPPPITALSEPATRDTVTTREHSSSSHCITEVLPLPPSSEEKKCVLGSFEDTDHSDSRSQTKESRTDQPPAHEQNRSAGAFFESSSDSPIHPSGEAAVGPLNCSRVSASTTPVLESTSCLTFSPSPSVSIRLSRLPPAEKKTRSSLTALDVSTSPRSGAEDYNCQDSEKYQRCRLSHQNSSAAVPCRGCSSHGISRGVGASRPRQCSENASGVEGTRLAALQSPCPHRDPRPIAFPRERGKLSQRQHAGQSSPLTQSHNSSHSSLSCTSFCCLEDCVCRAAPTHQRETSHSRDTGYSRKSTCASTIFTSRSEEADSGGATPLGSEKLCVQQGAQQRSKPVAETPERRYTSLPLRRTVSVNCHGTLHTGVSCDNGREPKFPLRNGLPLLSRQEPTSAAMCGEQQRSSSFASDVQRHVPSPDAHRLHGQRRRSGERAAFVLNELQQLRQLVRGRFVGGRPFRRRSLQHRFRQLQSTLQQLLASSDVGGANSRQERVQPKLRSKMSSSTSGSSASPATSAHPSTPKHSTSWRREETCGRINVAQSTDDVRSVRGGGTVAGRTLLRGYQASFTSADKRVPQSRHEQTDYATTDNAEKLRSLTPWEERASMPATLEIGTSPGRLFSGTNHAQVEQTKAAAEDEQLLDEEVPTGYSARERARRVHVEQHRSGEGRIVDKQMSSADADDALTDGFSCRDSPRLDGACAKEVLAKSIETVETVSRHCRHHRSKPHERASLTDALVAWEGQSAQEDDIPRTSEKSLPDLGKYAYPKSLGPAHIAGAGQSARDRESRCRHSSFIVHKAASPRCSEVLGSNGDTDSLGNNHAWEGDNNTKQRRESPLRSKKTSATVPGSCSVQQERSSCATYSDKKTPKSLRARRRRRVVPFHVRSRRRRPRRIRHLRSGFKQPVSPALKLIPGTYKGDKVAPEQQSVYRGGARLRLQLSPFENTMKPRSTGFAIGVSPSVGAGKAPPEVGKQSGKYPTGENSSPNGETRKQREATTSPEPPPRRDAAEGKPGDSTNALSKTTGCISVQHPQGHTMGNEDDDTGDTSGVHRDHRSVTKTHQVACRNEAALVRAASASSAKVELVQAAYRFLQRHLAERQNEDTLEEKNSVSRIRHSALQLGLAKGGDLSPPERCEEARPGLLLASCLGIMADYGREHSLNDLCKLLIITTVEQTQEGESGSARKIGGSRSGEGEVLQAATEGGSHDVVPSVLPSQTAGALTRKATLPPRGWAGGRAATRYAQKKHKQHPHQKRTDDHDEMLEHSGHLESTSISSVIQQKPIRKKTSSYAADATTWDHSRHAYKTAFRPNFRQGGGIHWELLRTARRAARRKETKGCVLVGAAETEHHNSSRVTTDGPTSRRERNKSTLSALRVLPDLRASSDGSSRRSSTVHFGSNREVRTSQSSTGSQNSAAQKDSVAQGSSVSEEQPRNAGTRSQNHRIASRRCNALTDDDDFFTEGLPTFDGLFNMSDLIPDAWYEEAEGSGNAVADLSSGVTQSRETVTKCSDEAGQWVLEPDTSTSLYDAPGNKKLQPDFFRMMLEEKECAPPSEVSLEKTPTAASSSSQLPALWNVPDDLVELVDSVPGGSPSALRPPCALRLLPTSSSSSSPSSGSTSRSFSANSPTSSSPSSASSSSLSASSTSRLSSTASSPRVDKHSADKGAALPVKKKPPVRNGRSRMLTHQQHSPADIRWTFESSSEHDEQAGDSEWSHSDGECGEDVTCKQQDFGCSHMCEDDEGGHSATTGDAAPNYSWGVGFFQRALAHEDVRSRFTHPVPAFVTLCHQKNSSSPNQRRKVTKANESFRNRKSRTKPPPRVPAPDRPKSGRKHRRPHRREECLKQRLAALHRDNLSHEEYMGQFARRLSLTAVHKVFCIELTKAERCSLPYTTTLGETSIDTHHSAARNNGIATIALCCSESGEGSPSCHAETGVVNGSFCANENCATSLCKAPQTTSVMTIEGSIAEQLRHRGWVMNKLLSDSHFFDLKWKLSDVDEDYRNLRREQLFNHFQNNRVITTKGGLARSLRRLAVEERVDVDLFFPRCYHLSSLDECSDFLLDYSRCEALTVLLSYLRCHQATPDEFHTVMVSEPLPSNSSRRSAALLLWMAYHIASVWLHELNPDLYLDRMESIEQQGRLDPQRLEVFASHAWHFRSQTQAFLREWHAIAQCGKALNDTVQSGEMSEDEVALSCVTEGKNFSWSTKNLSRAPLGSQVLRLLHQLQTWWPLWQLERGNCNLVNLRETEEAFRQCEDVVGREERDQKTEQKLGERAQNGEDGTGRDHPWNQHNVWIMKPSSNSKASGIHCLNNPWEILRAGRGLSDRLIQKYVERPLLLPCRRKFDMRQWVLVRSFDPLQVYVFSTLYLRLCSETYDLRDLQNRFRHVSNRHLNKLNSDTQQVGGNTTTKDTYAYPSGCGANHAPTGVATGLDSCQPLAELEAMLAERTGNPQFFQENIMPQIRHIVLQTLRAARPSVVSRPNSFELYGFDILLDESYRAWLIEVNLSPACAASADWQKQMVQQMTGGLLDLLFRSDTSGALYGKDASSADVGHWTLVFDESVHPAEAIRTFPPVKPTDETLAAGYLRVQDNPFLQFYSQPTHKRRGSVLAPRATGGITGLYPACTRGEDKSKSSQAVASAATSWDKMVVVGEHLSRQAEAALDSWCRFTEARNRIISWWRRTAWKRRAARRKTLALCEGIEVDYFFGTF